VVLAIDDSPTILKVVQLVLSRSGYRVHIALDGEEGLRMAHDVQPQLILLDFVMPKMNGYQVCRALAEAPDLRDVPVVLMSAKGDQVGERFVKVMGIVDYITKPFSPEAITAVVDHTVAKYARLRDPPTPVRPTELPLGGEGRLDTDPGDLVLGEDDDEDRTGRVQAVSPRTLQNLPMMSEEEASRPPAEDLRRRRIDALREAIALAVADDQFLGNEVADLVRVRFGDEVVERILDALPGLVRSGAGLVVIDPSDGTGRTDTSELPDPGEVVPVETIAEGVEYAEEEVLAGDLARVPIAEVLSLLDQQRQTGVLTVRRGDKQVEICFRGGKVDFAAAENLGEEFLIGNFILEREVMSRQDLELFFRSRGTSAKLCGEQLVKLGYITNEDLRQALARQTAERIYEVLRWSSGRFALHAVSAFSAPAERAALALSVEGILMEGCRRIDEWHLIEREIDDFDAVFLKNEDAVGRLEPGQLSRDEMAVLDLVNAKNSVRDIVRQSRMGAFEVSQMLFRLRSIRLIRRRVQPVAV
jgi:CheY-like chemotaxis protein